MERLKDGTHVHHTVQDYDGVVCGITRMKSLFEDSDNEWEYRIDAKEERMRIASPSSVEILEVQPKSTKGVRNSGRSKEKRSYWSFDQALDEFCRKYPDGGFNDPEQIREEREYKQNAHDKLSSKIANGLLEQHDKTATLKELLRIESATNLLFSMEKMALRDGLSSDGSLINFLRTLSEVIKPDFTMVEVDEYFNAIKALPSEKGKTDAFKWPVATIFPFLANPQIHMFMKPQFTKRAAERVGVSIDYTPEPNAHTYKRLIYLAEVLLERLRPIGAVDFIDVQTFIWLTGKLEDGSL